MPFIRPRFFLSIWFFLVITKHLLVHLIAWSAILRVLDKCFPYFPDTSCIRHEATYSTGRYSSLVFSMTYERLFSFYIRNLILPNAVLLFLSGLTFFIPCELGDRVGYGVTVTLALCVNLIIVIDFIPETSKTIPNVCNYFLVSIFLSGVSLIMATVSINLNWIYSNILPKIKRKATEQKNAALDEPMENKSGSLGNDEAGQGVFDILQNSRTQLRKPAFGKVNDEDSSSPRDCCAMVNIKMKSFFSRSTIRKIDGVLGAMYMIGSTLYTVLFLLSLK